MQIDPDEEIQYEDKETMYALFHAMCLVENGCDIPHDKIVKGYSYT